MNYNVVFGILFAFFAIYFGAPDIRINWALYIRQDAFILVFVGTLASSLISSSFRDFKSLFKLFLNVILLKKKQLNLTETIKVLVHLSEQAQSVSKQNLPQVLNYKKDMFLNRSVEMMASGIDKHFISQTLETDIIELSSRHAKMSKLLRMMGSYAPMFGMAGTVIGVIQVLKDVSDIENIVSGMALALLTTLYGLIFASIIFIPLSNKLKALSSEEVLIKEVIREGIELIYDKELPLKVEKYLTAYIETSQKEFLFKKA